MVETLNLMQRPQGVELTGLGAEAPVSPELDIKEIVEGELTALEEAYRTGQLRVPETLSDTTRDQKGPMGHDGHRKLYH